MIAAPGVARIVLELISAVTMAPVVPSSKAS